MNTAFESLFFDRNDHLREQHFTLDLMGNYTYGNQVFLDTVAFFYPDYTQNTERVIGLNIREVLKPDKVQYFIKIMDEMKKTKTNSILRLL